jgi:hypothetical protein
MAVIYRRVGGRKLTKVIAMHRDVQLAIDEEAAKRAVIAEALLNTRAKHRTGTSTIDVDKGDVDAYVVLDDTRGLHAALSIEYGRNAEVQEIDGEEVHIGAAEGLWVLHDAFDIPHGR